MSAPRTYYLVPAGSGTLVRATPVQRSVVPAVAGERKTPAIRPAPASQPRQTLKRAASVTSSIDPIEELLSENGGPSAPRKRERLTHLTAEQKLNRRKMKNRVAAQTARDRKKIRSMRLEDVVRQLLDENTALREENARLRAAVEEQSESSSRQQPSPSQYQRQQEYKPEPYHQNKQEELEEEEEDCAYTTTRAATSVTAASSSTFESAAFINAPQQRVQVAHVAVGSSSSTTSASTTPSPSSSLPSATFLLMLQLLSTWSSSRRANWTASSKISRKTSTSTSSRVSCPASRSRTSSRTSLLRRRPLPRTLCRSRVS